jgi:hypothetical protein
MTAPNQQNPDPEPGAGQGNDADKPIDGVSTPEPAEGADDVNPPLPGSPRG